MHQSHVARSPAIEFFIGIVALIFGVSAALSAETAKSQSGPELFSIEAHNTTSLQALMDFSAQNHVPLGIVLADHPSLCIPQTKLVLKNVTLEKILDTLLLHSGYTWSSRHGVYLIKPDLAAEQAGGILQLKYSRFESMETTMQGLGVVLSGYIQSRLEPDKGFAGNILSSTQSTTVKPFRLENVTVEQIANYIVSLDEKGVWILRTAPEGQSPAEKVALKIYGYKDDAAILAHMGCAKGNQD